MIKKVLNEYYFTNLQLIEKSDFRKIRKIKFSV